MRRIMAEDKGARLTMPLFSFRGEREEKRGERTKLTMPLFSFRGKREESEEKGAKLTIPLFLSFREE